MTKTVEPEPTNRWTGPLTDLEQRRVIAERGMPPTPGDEEDAVAVRVFGAVNVHQQR